MRFLAGISVTVAAFMLYQALFAAGPHIESCAIVQYSPTAFDGDGHPTEWRSYDIEIPCAGMSKGKRSQ